MAKPIQSTPHLEGKASIRFNQQFESNKSLKVTSEEKVKIHYLVGKILSKNK